MSAGRGVLILSDLHLSEGRDPESGFVSRQEDFFFDDEFCAFLEHHSGEEWSGMKWTLIVNGDFLDFLQVVSSPPAELYLRSDPTFGPKAGPLESAWKVSRIVRGHSELFRSLARFVLHHRLVLIAGNHDAEFYYGEVQEAFLLELCEYLPPSNWQALRKNVEFLPWFYYSDGIYVEHGHQYDPLNSFKYQLDPRLPDIGLSPPESGDLDLPLGSLFVRYLFNRVETESPFADNIKPATRFLKWFALNHPLRSVQFLLTDGPEMLGRIRSRWRLVPDAAYLARERAHRRWIENVCRSKGSGPVTFEALDALHQLHASPLLRSRKSLKSRLIRGLLGRVRTLVALSVLFIMVILGSLAGLLPFFILLIPVPAESVQQAIASVPFLETGIFFLRWIFILALLLGILIALLPRSRNSLKPLLREKAIQIQKLLEPKLVVMGHSHEVDLARLTPESEYFNTGTWTKVFSQEPRIIREEKELTFLRVISSDGGWKAKLMKWEGTQHHARLAYLFFEDQK